MLSQATENMRDRGTTDLIFDKYTKDHPNAFYRTAIPYQLPNDGTSAINPVPCPKPEELKK
jgi:hypothetical protein